MTPTRYRFKALLFDMDGTLVDSRLTIAHYFIEALNACRISHVLSPETIGQYVAMPFWEINLELCLNLSPEHFEQFVETYRRMYLLDPTHGSKLYPGVASTLASMRAKGYRIGLATGKRTDVARAVIHALGLDHYFDCIQGWEAPLKAKPDPDILQEALKFLEVKPQDALMIGDTAVDLQAASAAGVPACAVTYGFGHARELEAHKPLMQLGSFHQLPQKLEELL